jgi:hypothetical protein
MVRGGGEEEGEKGNGEEGERGHGEGEERRGTWSGKCPMSTCYF